MSTHDYEQETTFYQQLQRCEALDGDGKELGGSIEKGAKRGEVLLQLVRHSDRAVLGQQRYNGMKESAR